MSFGCCCRRFLIFVQHKTFRCRSLYLYALYHATPFALSPFASRPRSQMPVTSECSCFEPSSSRSGSQMCPLELLVLRLRTSVSSKGRSGHLSGPPSRVPQALKETLQFWLTRQPLVPLLLSQPAFLSYCLGLQQSVSYSHWRKLLIR